MYNQSSISSASYHHYPMPSYGIHGNLLEVTVICCNKLKDTEWISRQDPYVCVEYGSNRSRTRICTDGGKNPTFQERFVYILIEGLRELNITVWNSNTLSHDDFIGSGKVQLAKVLSDGFDDSMWPLQTKTGRHAGEIRLIMHYSNANKLSNGYTPSPPPYVTPSAPQSSMYTAPPQASMYTAPTQASLASYPPAVAYSPPSSYPSYPPNSDVYPPSPYPPQQYPPNSVYPPSPYGSHYPPGSSYPTMYPPPY